MKKVRISITALLIASITFTTACNVKEVKNNGGTNSTNNIEPADFRVTENKDIYKNEKLDVQDIYVTVLDKSNKWSLSDINNYSFNRESSEEEPPNVEVIFHGSKPTDNIHALKANAILQPRGHSTTATNQKSYKIKLYDNAIEWNGLKTLNLNKHPYDIVRVRNKLSFDYLKLLPDMFSLRTQFCHVYIRDLRSENKEFVDYGLFTNVEQVNKQYLRSHGIAEEAYMYKAENFEFYRYADKIKNIEDKGYDKAIFEQVLEINGVENHSRLIKMLEDVNNESLNINDVINKHFDRQNYLTWLATNILMGNNDTKSQNFILVSPTTTSRWYFIPWDYDGAWGYEDQPRAVKREYAQWEVGGITKYWGVVLHRRFFKDSKNVEELSKKVDELSKIMNVETTTSLLQKYYDITAKYVKSEPDIRYLRVTDLKDYEAEYKRLPGVIEQNRVRFHEGLDIPMPIFLGEPKKQNNAYIFNWDKSYDLQGDDLYYDFKISKDPEFKNIVAERQKLYNTDVEIQGLGPGKYYWKVEIYDSKGHHQIAFDKYTSEFGDRFLGMKQLIVE